MRAALRSAKGISSSSQAWTASRITATAIVGVGHVIRGIVFDFDGLILDTEEPIFPSWLEVYEAHGEDLPFERWVQIVGSTTAGFHPQHHLEERLRRPLPEEGLDRRAAPGAGDNLGPPGLAGRWSRL